MHHTTESDSAVCIIPQSLAPPCASHHGDSNLPSICFDLKFLQLFFLWDTLIYYFENNRVCHILFKGIVSRDFGGLQMILINRIGVPDVPLEVYSFLNFRFHIVI